MKTKNVIIIVGVLGVGAVGAYMFLKNKKAKDALLSGSLPATNQGGATASSGTTTSDTTTSSNTTSGSAASGSDIPIGLSTTDGIQPSNYALNLENAQRIVSDITWLLQKGKKQELIQKYISGDSILAEQHGVKQIREGVVIKSLEEEQSPLVGRKILKCINPDYEILRDENKA